MDTLEIVSELGLTLDNGECLELVKGQRDNLRKLIGDMKKKDQSFKMVQEKLCMLIAYDTLIESFEKYLNHEKE